MSAKILVAAPTSRLKDYCFQDYAQQLRSFEYMNYDTFMVDNSTDPDYVKTIWEAGIDAQHIEPGGSPIEYVTLSQNMIRNKAINGGYDWLFMLESDVFVPPSILQYLMMHANDVHTFPYFIKNGLETTLCLQAITSRVQYQRAQVLDPMTSMSMFTGDVKPISQYKIGCDVELYATGIGCTFIHRSVLERFEFRINKKAPHIFSDSYFYNDLRTKKQTAILDTTFLPVHRRADSWVTDIRLVG